MTIPTEEEPETIDYVHYGQESIQLLIDRVIGKNDSIEWNQVKELDGVVVFRGVLQDNEWNCIKAVGKIHCSVEKLAEKLTNPFEMKIFDENTEKCHVLQVINNDTKLLHIKTKAIFPTTPRDFVVLTAKSTIQNGIVIATRSIQHENVPVDYYYVRGTTYLSGYLLESISDKECEVTMMVHLNLGGSIPSFLINMLSVDAPIHLLNRLRDLYDEGNMTL